MKKYNLINNIAGWSVFAVAALTYLLTIEPTASFWDCGEFITSAFKLEVGHPPGAPFFMILGRFFTLFAFGNLELVAKMVNILSAAASAFTILFLFWSITHIAKRIISKTNELTSGQLITVISSGIIGALVYTFSDTFWFSAVEGEVYATSSFFTAIVFWAILKWESEADQKYSNRWLILIAYLMGLSIGVHLLNLLAIPAIVYIYYFKKYETSKKGIIYAALVSIALLIIIMYGIVQGLFVIGSQFELLFVNEFGLPFFSGLFFYFLALFAGIAYGIYYTYKHKKILWNTIFTMFAVILIGYSSFALILIRSQADTPMNQNKPDNVFELLGYLNREQYGDRPLLYGNHFNSELDQNNPYEETKNIYFPKTENNGKDYYKVVDKKIRRNYKGEDQTIFPRMYSEGDGRDHIKGYINWLNKTEGDFYFAKTNPETNEPIRNRYGEIQYDQNRMKRLPSFGENLSYFFKYQMNFMYFRYFMWNFAGRQNDIQGHGNVKDGNWISGIKFIDEMRIGNQDQLTDELKNNKARNVYYFLPLLMGILGMIYMYKQGKKGIQYFWVVMLFFFFTGIAIVLYLNQPPFQPRERDYAYAGSFYVFTMFIGFGVAFIYNLLKRFAPEKTAAILAGILTIGIPVLMAQQNWDDHNRSNRYTAADYARNYLESCDENAIIFTNGDNDTFPLWYIQEVEGYRTDVRVINLSYFNTEWYIDQMTKRAYKSAPIKFTLTKDQYDRGKRDVLYTIENPGLYLSERYESNKELFEAEYASVFNEYISYLEHSNFKSVFPKEYNTLSKGYNFVDPVQFFGFTQKLSDENLIKSKNLNLSLATLTDLNVKINTLLEKISEAAIPLSTIIKHIAQENNEYKAPLQNQEMVNYLPTSKFIIPVNKESVLKNKIVAQSDSSRIESKIKWDINKQHITKNEMMVLDMLATNNWERPIYFATTVGNSLYLNLENYFQLEGLAYKVVPILSQSQRIGSEGRINSDILYDKMMNKFKWGGLDVNPEKLYLDENNRRFIMNFKSSFIALAEQLIQEKKFEKAEAVLDKCTQLFPNKLSAYNYYDLIFAEDYFKINKPEKALSIFKTACDNFQSELEYYLSLDDKYLGGPLGMSEDVGRLGAIYQEALGLLYDNNQDAIAQQYTLKAYNLIENRYLFSSQMGHHTNSQEQQLWYSNLPDYQKGLLQFHMSISEYMNKE